MAGHELVGGQPIHDPRGTGEEPEEIGTDPDLVDGGADGLAGIRALEPAQHVGVRLEGVGDLEHQQGAILRRRLLPGLERGRGGAHGAVHVLLRARRDVRDDLIVGRVDDIGGAAIRGVHEVATDELLVGLDGRERVGHGASLLGRGGVRGECRHPSPVPVLRSTTWAPNRSARDGLAGPRDALDQVRGAHGPR